MVIGYSLEELKEVGSVGKRQEEVLISTIHNVKMLAFLKERSEKSNVVESRRTIRRDHREFLNARKYFFRNEKNQKR